MSKKKAGKQASQLRLWIVANAGGVGKTTLGIHVGYGLAQKGLKVLFIDLDTNGSLARFCGLDPDLDPSQTSATLFDRTFSGQYPVFTPEWVACKGNFDLCLGGDVMLSVALDLPSRTGREFILKKVFNKYPNDYDVVILDSPASLDAISYCALACSTHILMPLPMSVKMTGLDALLQWIRIESDALDLEPVPSILGGVPMKVAGNADQKAFYSEIEDVLEEQNIKCYQGVRFSAEFENASNRGIAPLQIYRPKHPASKDFEVIVKDIVKVYKA